jgi:hypothetical protein
MHDAILHEFIVPNTNIRSSEALGSSATTYGDGRLQRLYGHLPVSTALATKRQRKSGRACMASCAFGSIREHVVGTSALGT